MDRHLPALLERLAWLGALVVGVYVVGAGLVNTFQIELTDEALREQARGVWMIRIGSLGLLAATAYAVVRGATPWAWVPVLLMPVLCGGLSETMPDALLAHLVFLAAAPIAGLGALAGLFVTWSPHRRHDVPAAPLV